MTEFSQNFSERQFLGSLLSLFKVPDRITTREWAESRRILTTMETSTPGPMDCSKTPWMFFLMECLDNPEIRLIVGKKSARIAWTTTINSWVGKTMETDPRNIGIAFPRAASRENFFKEFLKPLLQGTPVLFELVTRETKFHKLSHKFIPFPGGNLKLINLGSADEAKSSFIPYIIIEEPDGVKQDVNNQGNGLSLIAERKKSADDWKIIFGGTPTEKDFSQVEAAYEQVTPYAYMVPCHVCGNFHELSFSQLKYDRFEDQRIDPLYGVYDPETVRYGCPYCSSEWSYEQKNRNVAKAVEFHNQGWKVIGKEIHGTAGFAFNELLSSFENSNFKELAKAYLKAFFAYEQGNEGLLKAFYNNQMGQGYAPLTVSTTVEDLIARRLSYHEGIVPLGGIVLTATIDKQRGGVNAKSRLAITVRAWGRNNNSWLVQWIELFGDTTDSEDKIWEDLILYLKQEWQTAINPKLKLKISAACIDAGDDTEVVYQFITRCTRTMDEHGNEVLPEFPNIFAIRGTADHDRNADIYNDPSTMIASSVDQQRKALYEKHGVTLYLVGTYATHEELMRRLMLTGKRDRWYYCESLYPGYESGLLSCRKDPASRRWKQVPGRPKEVTDCERYQIWISRAIGLHRYLERDWNALEHGLLQTIRN